ncbi:Twitching motility protein PilT [uncultured Defluviicoccus sp.]|uniref:Twitching motility protein PilT n=1 Tax=metagenome TaxID=256318 RepID=A0A380TC39_9ZZZZ|nr:Twitching motility protein PilT [uncultured Defluviicoccus sp.]HRW61402.1 type II toxin-antitoxin system VapC family toxin [Defluviicoccus sp.]
MRRWLLDTNVISELRKPRCDPAVKAWADAQAPDTLHLSRVTLAEIRFGIERVTDATFRGTLLAWLDDTLRPWFAGRILDIDEDVLLTWRRMVERGRKVNYTFSQPDLFIAATAAVNWLSVATRNVDDFICAEVPIFDPWTGRLIEPGAVSASADEAKRKGTS